MARTYALLFCFIVAGCRSAPLPVESDGGSPDSSTSTCAAITSAKECTAHSNCAIAGCPNCSGGIDFMSCYNTGDIPTIACPAIGCAAQLDLSVQSCQSIFSEVQTYIDTHAACQSASDCVTIAEPCGLPGQCGLYIRKDASNTSALDNEWEAAG